MDKQWIIRPLCFGEFPEFEKSVVTYLRSAGEKIRVPILGGCSIRPGHDLGRHGALGRHHEQTLERV